MSRNITLFPPFDSNKCHDIIKVGDISFYYKNGENVYPLEKVGDEDSNIFALKDRQGYWTPNNYEFLLKWEVTTKDVFRLFGSESSVSCACTNASLGIALQWYSKDSRQRKTVPIAEFNKDSDDKTITAETSFAKGQLRGNVMFELVVYLKTSGEPLANESHFANVPGYVLGTICSMGVELDGSGSEFLIFEIDSPNGPLWMVQYDGNEPESDMFSESVEIRLNRANKNFNLINRNDKEHFSKPMLVEILANAMITVVEKVRDLDRDFDCLDNPEEGSVAMALKYFNEKLSWNFDDPISTSTSIRKYFENNNIDI